MGRAACSAVSLGDGLGTWWRHVVVDAHGVIWTALEQLTSRADREGGAQQQVDRVLAADDEHQGDEHR
jgi:hypothetical protein